VKLRIDKGINFMTTLHEVTELGQAIWLDFIRRSFMMGGEFAALIRDGLRGVTSNPSIFEKAIAGSADYDDALPELVAKDLATVDLYEALAVEDVQQAADLLRPLYDQTDGGDGFVSLEVSPTLADDTDATIADARRLFARLGRPNVMIKVPATLAGIPAIETLIGEGININATLMFSLQHYDAVAGAYIAGLERLAGQGGNLRRVASVASFFVSRLDTVVDRELEAIGTPEAQDLLGKAAIANSKMAYARFQEIFGGGGWQALEAQGARVQRPLWASTSTKNPRYPDTLYVDALIGPHTVNTVPPDTLAAFRDHGKVSATLLEGWDEARSTLDRLTQLGINLDAITQGLQVDGVRAFAQSFESLLTSVAEKRQRMVGAR